MSKTMRFEKAFYQRAGIDAAVEAYGQLAVFRVEEKERAFLVNITDCEEQHTEAIADHFGNHVLFASLACQVETL